VFYCCVCPCVAAVAEVGDAMRCPASKFITHTLSNLTFLILLTAGTFRLGDKIYPTVSAVPSVILSQPAAGRSEPGIH